VKKYFFEKRYPVDGDFEGWWEAVCLEIKPKIKTKRVNLMGNVSRIFKVYMKKIFASHYKMADRMGAKYAFDENGPMPEIEAFRDLRVN